MPAHLAIPRREFLTCSAAGTAAACLLFNSARADDPAVDHDLVAILNDTHVSENTSRAPNGQNIAENLRHVVAWLKNLPKRPAAVLVNGDLAHNAGLPGDYRQLAELLRPLALEGWNVHLTLGNHDDRQVFFEEMSAARHSQSPVESRHVAVVQTPRANFFLLDSLVKTSVVHGVLGDEQLRWLSRALDEHADRPALVILHHNPQFKPAGPEAKFTWSGLMDSAPLFDVLEPRRHVKAFVHGHIHSWGLGREQEIHVVNTPACGYVGNPQTSTTGWTMLRLADDAGTFTTYTIDGEHPWHDKSHRLAWRV